MNDINNTPVNCNDIKGISKPSDTRIEITKEINTMTVVLYLTYNEVSTTETDYCSLVEMIEQTGSQQTLFG